MAEHEPIDNTGSDSSKVESRGARVDRSEQAAHGVPSQPDRARTESDATAAASEPMELQRLPESANRQTPPGRQRTGDPPASKHTG